MDLTELRIGNLINLCGEEKEVMGLIQMSQGGELVIQTGNINSPCRHSVAHVEPIPITEEWLMKMGYESVTNRIILDTDLGKISFFVRNMNVHTFQNLYFALTGEELLKRQQQRPSQQARK
jgi:hypothetical protein